LDLKNVRTLELLFETVEQQKEVYKAIKLLAFGTHYSQMYVFHNKEVIPFESEPMGWAVYDIAGEFRRQGLIFKEQKGEGESKIKSKSEILGKVEWKLVDNTKYKLVSTYPKKFAIPRTVSKSVLKQSAELHFKRRMVALSWKSPQPFVVSSDPSQQDIHSYIFRCANHPHLHLTGKVTGRKNKKRVKNDPNIIGKKIFSFHKEDPIIKHIIKVLLPGVDKLHILDIQPTSFRKSEKEKNKTHSFPLDDNLGVTVVVTSISLADLEAVNRNLIQLKNFVMKFFVKLNKSEARTKRKRNYETLRSEWNSGLSDTGWLQGLKKLLEISKNAAMHIRKGSSVIVQSLNGKEHVPQITSLVQLLVDPYYRTIIGFSVLIEKEWSSFGHKWGQRQTQKKFSTSINVLSCIFLQFLDLTWQLWIQNTDAFEFNREYIIFLIDSVYSARFGTFMIDTDKMRHDEKWVSNAVSLWSYIDANKQQFLNPKYSPLPYDQQLNVEPPQVILWCDYYLRYQRRYINKTVSNEIFNFVQESEVMNPVLDLSYSRLHSVPETLDKTQDNKWDWNNYYVISQVQQIKLDHNFISIIDKNLSHLSNLLSFDISDNNLVSISHHFIQAIPALLKLEELYLQNNQLISIPNELVDLVNLRILDIRNNNISYLPSLSPLTRLEELHMSGNPEFESFGFPLSILKLTNLKQLDISNNNLINLHPRIFEKLTKLEYLDVGGNKFTTNPQGMSNLESLRIFKMSFLNLREVIPQDLFLLTRLRKLVAEGIRCEKLPDDFANLVGLRELDLSNNSLKDVPEVIISLSLLKTLNLSHNNISFVPTEITELENLRSLDISYNNIRKLTPGIGFLKELVYLDVSSNEMNELPPQLGLLSNIQTLNIDVQKITSPPPAVVSMGHTALLHYMKRHLEGQEEFYRMKLMFVGQENVGKTSLVKYLMNEPVKPGTTLLSTDGIDISEWIVNIKQDDDQPQLSQEIKLESSGESTPLTPHPPSPDDSKNILIPQHPLDSTSHDDPFLEKIDKPEEKSQLPVLPQQKKEKRRTVQLKRRESSQKHKKLMSGKDSLNALLSQSLDISGHKSLRGVSLRNHQEEYLHDSGEKELGMVETAESENDIYSVVINKPPPKIVLSSPIIKVTLSAWDFAGQDIYYTTHQFFLSEQSLYLLVFDLSKPLEHSKIEFWLQSIWARTKQAPVIIIGTHRDSKNCTPEFLKAMQVRLAEFHQTFPNITAINFVSNQTGLGMENLRKAIEEIVIQQKHVGQLLPKRYSALEKALILEREKKKANSLPPICKWEEYSKIAELCLIDDEKELEVATSLLHNLGSLIHFGDDEKLRDIIILHPQWLTDVMSSVFTTKANFVKNGILSHVDLPLIWRPPVFPVHLHSFLITLLNRFEIAFSFTNPSSEGIDTTCKEELGVEEGYSLIPCLLPPDRPFNLEEDWPPRTPNDGISEFGRIYKFSFVPSGFFGRVMVRLLGFKLQTARKYWKHGLIIFNYPEKLMVEYFPDHRQMKVTIRTESVPDDDHDLDSGIEGSILLGKSEEASYFQTLSLLVFAAIDSLVNDWYELDVTVSVPCTHCVSSSHHGPPYLFDFQDLQLALFQPGVSYVTCAATDAPVSVRIDQLVPDVALVHLDGFSIDINELEFGELVDSGSFSEVYKGVWKGATLGGKQSPVVAIKKFTFGEEVMPEANETVSAIEDFLNEIWIMSGLKHPNIVPLLGFCLDPCCIVSEFMDNGNLLHYLQSPQSESLDWPLRLKIAKDVAKGCEFLHGASPPVIHRDLKSPNIMLSSDLSESAAVVAKVIDFGTSINAAQIVFARKVDCPVWLAPEVMEKKEYTIKADVYGFGVILYELLIKDRYFAEITFMSKLEDLILSGHRPEIPEDCLPEYKALIEACWHSEPEERPLFVDIVKDIKAIMLKYSPDHVEYDGKVSRGLELEVIRPPPQQLPKSFMTSSSLELIHTDGVGSVRKGTLEQYSAAVTLESLTIEFQKKQEKRLAVIESKSQIKRAKIMKQESTEKPQQKKEQYKQQKKEQQHQKKNKNNKNKNYKNYKQNFKNDKNNNNTMSHTS